MRHEDDDEAYDASDDGDPHVGEHDVAILYADQLDKLAAAGFTPDALTGAVTPPLTLVGEQGPEWVTLPEAQS